MAGPGLIMLRVAEEPPRVGCTGGVGRLGGAMSSMSLSKYGKILNHGLCQVACRGLSAFKLSWAVTRKPSGMSSLFTGTACALMAVEVQQMSLVVLFQSGKRAIHLVHSNTRPGEGVRQENR